MAVQLSHQGKEIEELKDGLRDARAERKRIYERLEKQEHRCIAIHGERRERSSADNAMDTWWNKKIAWVTVGIIGPALGVIGTKIVEKML